MSEVKVSKPTVNKWVHRVGDTVASNVSDAPRSGRPPTATAAVAKRVVSLVKNMRKRSVRNVSQLLRRERVRVGKSTVHRVLHEAGLHAYHRHKQPLLTVCQKKKRVKFAKDYMNHDWTKTLMTDECDFELFPTTNPHNDVVWSDNPSSVPPVELVSHSPKLSVWAGAWHGGKTRLVFYEGTLGSAQYVEILKKALPDFNALTERKPGWTFQPDGASPHKAAATNRWLEDHVPNYITSGPTGDWPPNSPDLNWMDNVWAIMKERLEERPPATLDALRKRIKKIWKELDQKDVQSMVKGMKKRLQGVVKGNGESLKK